MRRLALSSVVVLVALSTGCALRPRYRDFISDTTPGPNAKFVLYERDSDNKLANTKLEMSEWKNKIFITTAADGSFSLPVDKKYLEENPVIVVVLPQGVKGYDIEPAPSAAIE